MKKRVFDTLRPLEVKAGLSGCQKQKKFQRFLKARPPITSPRTTTAATTVPIKGSFPVTLAMPSTVSSVAFCSALLAVMSSPVSLTICKPIAKTIPTTTRVMAMFGSCPRPSCPFFSFWKSFDILFLSPPPLKPGVSDNCY